MNDMPMLEVHWFREASAEALHRWMIGVSDPDVIAGGLISDILARRGVTPDRLMLFVRECHRLLMIRGRMRKVRWNYAQKDLGLLLTAAEGWTRAEDRGLRRAEIAELYREILGNPFRQIDKQHKPWRTCWSCDGYGCHLGSGPDRGNPDCDTCKASTVRGKLPAAWVTPQVLALAMAARGGKDGKATRRLKLDPDRLAILGDACEEAGCPPEAMEIVRHLQGYRPYFDGYGQISSWKRAPGRWHPPDCWALSMVLGEH